MNSIPSVSRIEQNCVVNFVSRSRTISNGCLPRTTQRNSPTAPNRVPIFTLNQGQLSRFKKNN